MWSAAADEAMGGRSLSSPVVSPQDTRTKLIQALHYAQLLIPQGHNSVQDALNTRRPSLRDGRRPGACPQVIHNITPGSTGRTQRCKRNLTLGLLPLM